MKKKLLCLICKVEEREIWTFQDPYLETNHYCRPCYEAATKRAIAKGQKPRLRFGSDDDWAEYYYSIR